ncbi:Aspartic proteinase 3 [Komagataella phaffii CBS 7435]|uniref:Aspartic proteinase 3 n=1 Tax=Komagataella phaffii (strain ATCC 76273 / CBS 7435 / CECT 11047 / NRRL Y-11430 / Wegner 21-1) TaxID=981350 RepID=F2QX83_KOMPC|nr:GQ67_03187T0 [Komagataella phaffii]AOA69128.1 GQ68_03172T0 [Komagataella phaffii GS115]CAH2450101.1 Aspartic proteinase [Komagataella phaffii CBS 7435]CCA40011.1 Aspartic proteinase 3 [Komagataella phaffii CBS 7435]
MIINHLVLTALSIALASAQLQSPFKANKLPFKKVYHSNDPKDRLIKRDDYESLDLRHIGVLYTAEIQIGSDETEIEVIVDTGSADLWVIDSDAAVCELSYDEIEANSFSSASAKFMDKIAPPSQELLDGLSEFGFALDGEISQYLADKSGRVSKREENQQDFNINRDEPVCEQFGSFDSSSSDTFQSNNSAFGIAYLDGTTANGTWVRDTVRIGDFAISQQSFALVNITDNYMGILGLGPATQQTTNSNPIAANRFTYDGVVDSLRSQGFINSASFSVYLSPDEDNEHDEFSDGEILFGAIDRAKIDGPFRLFPYVNPYKPVYPDQYTSYVTVSTIAVSSSDETLIIERRPRLALIDTGATFSYLPTYPLIRLAFSIHGGFEYVSQLGLFVIRTSSLSVARNKVIEFKFGEDVVIQSPVSDHLLDVSGLFTDGQQYSALTVRESLDGLSILGDTFIKSAYLFFDNENSQLGIGQINVTDDEDIEVVGDFTIERDPAYSSTWSSDLPHETPTRALSTASGGGLGTGINTATSRASSRSTSGSTSRTSSTSGSASGTSSGASSATQNDETSTDLGAPAASLSATPCLFAILLLML